VVDHDPAVHGPGYDDAVALAPLTDGGGEAVPDASASETLAERVPVVRFRLRGAAPGARLPAGRVGHGALAGLVVQGASVRVVVTDAVPDALESDAGTLDPRKPFQPFGGEPAGGARLAVRWAEAFAKRLTGMRLTLAWKDAPASLAARYARYDTRPASNAHFTVDAAVRDATGTRAVRAGVPLFDAADATRAHAIDLALPGTAPTADGALVLTLRQDFLHAEYRRVYVRVLVAQPVDASRIPEEPYTPAVQSLLAGYTADTGEVPLTGAATRDALAAAAVRFHHLLPFGTRREHAALRAAAATASDVPLVAEMDAAGQLLVGLAGTGPGDVVTLLVQCAAGSADPEAASETPLWSVLVRDRWRRLTEAELTRDTTGRLLTSGVVQVVVPGDATTVHTALPSGRVWLRASVATNPAAVCRLLAVLANAVEVRFVDRGNDPAHLRRALPPGTLTKLRAPRAALAGVKALAQPFASFGGRPLESDAAFRARAAERLRHRGRAVTAWDCERLVLEAFPQLHRVRCLAHARPKTTAEGEGVVWHAPGHLLLVVVPDLRGQDAPDALRPRAATDVLRAVEAYVAARSGPRVRVHARNPRWQPVTVQCAVRLRRGHGWAHARGAIEAAIVRALAPWAFVERADDDVAPGFGGTVYRSAMLDLVEALPEVDWVSDFRLLTAPAGATPVDVAEARPATPDAILVPTATHLLTEAPDDASGGAGA
jgi:hypothetical protein